MSLFDDDRPARPAADSAHQIGQPLDRLSVDELNARVAALRSEIARLEAAISAKSAHRDAAESVFRS
ncbi:hypothetical protein GCM10008171_27400 [Methylopila jiangsuensis]|uniref:DUF1192 domain-containing protein n=1 Tax=Methylopila jiangsuensis TaxID=586230 RepID=A0A9W6N4Q3_9HYPH|nr:DUF1192 domain-containing protein [Methylopila jiangsuensis]MDR6285127.1 uncharacterized small protein (DUF1192 family) [Methylopila jiangsuensis]GLK77486.1 hypothetical protein GCM10008171_27400 [Methylopila jiangsuensis]